MGDFRFVFGTARGKEGNFQARTDNLFGSTDATPDVSDGNLFWTNNASATSITHFDVVGADPVSRHEGKEIYVGVLDGNTTFVNGAQLRLSDSQDVPATPGSMWHFIYHNSAWFQASPASLNTAGVLTAQSSNLGTTGLLTITPATTVVGLLSGVSSSMTLRGMPGGRTGQMVTFVNLGSSITFITNSAGATDSFVVSTVSGTSAIVTGSDAVTFVRAVQGTTAKWFETNGIA